MKPTKRVRGAFGRFNTCNFEKPKIAKVEHKYIIFCESVRGCTEYVLGYNEDFTDGIFKSYHEAKDWWNSTKSEYDGQLVGAYH